MKPVRKPEREQVEERKEKQLAKLHSTLTFTWLSLLPLLSLARFPFLSQSCFVWPIWMRVEPEAEAEAEEEAEEDASGVEAERVSSSEAPR